MQSDEEEEEDSNNKSSAESKESYNMKASSIDIYSNSKQSRSEVCEDDTSSFESSSEDDDENESEYSLADSYDAEVANAHDHELRYSHSMDQGDSD